MSPTDLEPRVPAGPARALTAAEFRGLAEVPPELEWFANIPNPRTRRAYQRDVIDPPSQGLGMTFYRTLSKSDQDGGCEIGRPVRAKLSARISSQGNFSI